jgi:hypothetical protein
MDQTHQLESAILQSHDRSPDPSKPPKTGQNRSQFGFTPDLILGFLRVTLLLAEQVFLSSVLYL